MKVNFFNTIPSESHKTFSNSTLKLTFLNIFSKSHNNEHFSYFKLHFFNMFNMKKKYIKMDVMYVVNFFI